MFKLIHLFISRYESPLSHLSMNMFLLTPKVADWHFQVSRFGLRRLLVYARKYPLPEWKETAFLVSSGWWESPLDFHLFSFFLIIEIIYRPLSFCILNLIPNAWCWPSLSWHVIIMQFWSSSGILKLKQGFLQGLLVLGVRCWVKLSSVWQNF